MATFTRVCKTLNVPIAVEKTGGPSCIMEFLGLAINSIDMTIQIPEKKLKELLTQIKDVAYSKKVTLKKHFSLYAESYHFVLELYQLIELSVDAYIWPLQRLNKNISFN